MPPSVNSPLRPFVAPARVLAGPGATAAAGAEMVAAGISAASGSVLIVADQALIGLGLVEPLRLSLDTAGFDAQIGPGIASEPTPDTVSGLIEGMHGAAVAAVIGIGGGSAIDASKLAAVALTNEIPLTAGLAPTAKLGNVAPIVAIPTTAGTGAETTAVAMLWHERQKRIFVHALLVPRIAVLDPDLLIGLPRPVAAASGMDAISHAIESMLSTFRSPLTTVAAQSALRRIAGALPVEFVQTQPQTRQEMSLGAYEAGLALNASVVIGHSIAYTIAARTGLSHGVTCAMALPYCLAYCRDDADDQIRAMAEIVGVPAEVDSVIAWVNDLAASLQIPLSLAAVGIAADELPSMAAECCERYPRPNNPRTVERREVERLLRQFHAGEIAATAAMPSR